MQELVPRVFIETGYPGVTLGAINFPHGLLLVDSPLRAEDARSWRTSLLNLSGGVDRLLVNLDAHPDRTLGSRAMECTVVGHDRMAQVVRSRPAAFKSQNLETGAVWESIPNLGIIKWAPPEICFTERLTLHWGESPVILEHHPGPSSGATWVHLPVEKVIFVGDAVIYHQPPFLSYADIPRWISSLEELVSPQFRDYFIVGGRNGILPQDEVKRQIVYLQKVEEIFAALPKDRSLAQTIEHHLPDLLALLKIQPSDALFFTQRLRWGLTNYLTRHMKTNHPAPEE